MMRKIGWACLAGMLSGSVFGAGSLYVKCANSVSLCDVYYYLSSTSQQSQMNYFGDGSESLSDTVVFDKGIVVSNIVIHPGYLPAVTVIDEYFYTGGVTNRISEKNGIYSHVPANLSNLKAIRFDLQTTLVTNTITYVINGGTLPADSPMAYTVESATVTLPQPNPVSTYHVFDGWYDNSDFTGTAITTIPTGSLGDRTFYAKWTPKVYSVKLNFDGGWISFDDGESKITTSPFTTNRTYGVDFTMPSFGRDGYVSGGWHVTADGSDTQSAVTYIAGNVTRNTEYWAKLTKQGYTVTLDRQGGTGGSAEVTVYYNEVMASILPPSRIGYDFEGYYDGQGGSGTIYYDAAGKATGAWPSTSGGKLYAHWTPHSYAVSFVGGEGATGEMAQLALTYDVAAPLPTNAFSKTGYQFAGWKTNETDGVTFADGQTVSNLTAEANGVVTMTATWSAGHYSIKFDANASDAEGEMAIQDIEYDEGTTLAANAFTREGYSLAGWAWDKDATTNEVDFADCQVVTNLTDEIDSTNTLYAVWKAEEYAVSLDANVDKGGYFRLVTNVVVTVTTNDSGTVTNVVEDIVKVTSEQAVVTYNTTYDLPVPVNEEARMTFDCWKYVDPETGDVKPLPETVPLHADGTTNLVAQWTDGLAVALNANGTDLEYTTGGYERNQNNENDKAPWAAQKVDGEAVGQSGNLLSDAMLCGSYLQTILPGKGVLTYRWRIVAPVGYYHETLETFYGRCLRFVADSKDLVPYLVTGDDHDPEGDVIEWRDSGWINVAYTNSSENPLTVKWLFESQRYVANEEIGGTGWVDNVTWIPAGGLRPVATVTPYDGIYDGAGHGIEVNVTQPASGATVKYALGAEGPYAEGEILFTNVTETAEIVWYTVEAENFMTVTNSSTVKISPKTLTDAMVSLAETPYTHDGTAKEPAVTVEDGELSIILTANDYDVAYSNNVEVGEATVVVTGKGNYAGEVLKHFTISSADDPPPTPAAIDYTATPYDETYDGAGHGITVNVTTPESGWAVKYALDAAGPYAEGEILFTNVTETAVTVCYTVEAEGYATVTNTSTVKISPKTLTDTMVSVEETSCTFDGSAKEPAVTVVDGNPSILTANDYDVAYSNNVAVGEATVVVTGKGNYTGEVLKHFTIALAAIVHEVSFYDGIYDGEGHGITVSVTKPENGATIQYARNQDGPYSTEPILFTNVTETAEKVWYTIEAEGYTSVTNFGRVKISPKVVPDGLEAKIPWPTDKDGAYNPLVANVYDGWIVEADGRLAGIVQVKAAKQAVKTVTDKATQTKTSVTNVAVTATVKDVAGKSWSYKGGVGTVEGVVTGLVCTTKGVAVASFGVKLGANGLSGKWNAESVLGARNGMGTKNDAMMAALEAYKGSWSAAFTNEAGATHLQLVVGAKGSTKVTGTTADGFKVSATVQGVMGEDAFFIPYLATLKSGKLTTEANLLLCIGADGAVAALTSSLGPLVAGGRTTDEIVFLPYVESVQSKGGEAYVGAVVLNDLAYPAKFAAKGLPAGLKIDAATGVIAGTPTKPGHYVATVTVTSGINSKAKVETTVEFNIANYTDDQIRVEDAYGSYRVGVKVCEPIAAALGCAVSGLPAGLKYAAKETKDATFGVVPAGTVYGVPTKAGESTVYFKKSTKETNDVGKVATVKHQASATFLVAALPAWAQGTFDGAVGSGEGAASPSGQVTLTVDAKGKISGKLLEGGKTWTLSAPAYEREDERDNLDSLELLENLDADSTFIATVVGKSGKEIMTNEMAIAAGLLRHYADDGFDVRGEANAPADGVGLPEQMAWTAWQNLWKMEPWKIDAKAFANKKLTLYVVDGGEAGLVVRDALSVGGDAYGTVELKFAASGAVTASGKFVTGQNAQGKDVIYSASSSSALIPESEVHYAVYLHFPPKAGKFDGYSVKVQLIWKDPMFQLVN